MTSQTDKDLHSIALTLRDILRELKQFDKKNYNCNCSERRGPRFILDDKGNMVREGEEDIYGESGSND